MNWSLRELPAQLRDRYLTEGWWTDDTLAALVERSLAAAPDASVTVWSADRPWAGTYADLDHEARRLVTVLRDAGLRPGDVVAFQMPNWREAMVAFYGLAMGGYVLVPIVHIYGRKEVEFILRESGAKAYLSAEAFGHVDYRQIIDACRGALPELALHLTTGDAWSVVEGAEPAEVLPTVDPDSVAVLAYTSGTTTNPKGVIHTHRTLLAELLHMRPWITPGEPNLMGSPVTHATGMLGAVLTPMQLSQDIHLIDRWDPDRVLDIMLEAGIGAGTGASVFLASLLFHPRFTAAHAAQMRRVGLGGAPVPIALAEHAATLGIEIIRAYGSTEHPSITGCTFDDPIDKRHRTDGPAMLGVDLRLVDGEIFSRGPDLCMGYTDPALTAAAFDADGWYRTGDMAVIDDDGFLTITDRANDMIIRGGENISAAEVEEQIAAMPEVVEVAVVAAPDPRLGEHACAMVRLDTGHHDLELDAVQRFLEHAGLARQKWPEDVRVVDDFPRTATGKIRKVDLREQLRDEA